MADEGSVAQNAFRVTRLLVPVDGSPNSQRAAEAAIGLAKQHHAQIMFLNVIPLPRLTYGAAGVLGAPAVPLDSYYEYAESQGENLIERLVELAKRDQVIASGEVVKSNESTVQSITERAKDFKADLIVIGTRGLSSFRKMLIGSVSSGVVTYADCPVLVVR